jgi:hypothetical protein
MEMARIRVKIRVSVKFNRMKFKIQKNTKLQKSYCLDDDGQNKFIPINYCKESISL